ncbi:MAG: AcrB/AcrD/AcrF family protein, partial [Anaerolineales bacterium]|nr:AcrB/AcrD/AcrF family protein [Anaerolineales bacterium]
AIPISVIATFALVYFGGFTLNIMTIGGLALGIGMLVDNAIVVLENIFRLRETGAEPDQAAVSGSEEVIPAIIASTLTTLAVFLPLVFVRGMSGVMFKQLSFVVGFSLLCSLGVAMTLVPMLAARVRHPEVPGVGAGSTWGRKISIYTSRLFAKFEDGYKHLLHVALEHRSLIIVAAILIMIGSLALIPLVGVEFLPSTDEGEVRVNAEMQVGTRLEMMDESFQRIESIVMNAVPELKNVVTYVGGPSWRVTGSHTGEMRVALKPQAERTRSSEEIAAVLRKKLSNLPGVRIRTRAGQGLFLLRLGTSGLDKVQVEIRGYDLDMANVLAEKVKTVIEDVDGVTDARVSRESGSP